MSTRALISIKQTTGEYIHIWKKCDGYPSSVIPTIRNSLIGLKVNGNSPIRNMLHLWLLDYNYPLKRNESPLYTKLPNRNGSPITSSLGLCDFHYILNQHGLVYVHGEASYYP